MSEHELWNELGNLYFMTGSYNQAIHAYTRSIALDRNFGRPYSNMALAYVQKGKYLEAIDLYQAGIRLLNDDHEKAWSWYKLGNVYRQLKDYRRAVEAYEHADELDPTYREIEYSNNKADALLNRKPTFEDTFRPVDEIQAVMKKEEPVLDTAPDPVLETVEQIPTPAPLPAPESVEQTLTPVEVEKPVIVIVEEDPIPASSRPSEPAPLLEELTPWIFDEETVPEVEEYPDFDSWVINDEDVITDDENIVFTEPLKWEVAFVAEASVEESSAELETVPVEETVTPLLDMPQTAQTISALPVASSSYMPIHQLMMQERQSGEIDIVMVEEKPAPLVFVISEGDDMTETPKFSEETVTSTEAVQYDAPAVEELPAFELSPAEMAKIQIDIEKFKRVLEINPGNAFAWDTLGGLYKASGRYDEAIAAYRKAISIDSSKSIYFHHLGLVYAAERKLEDAVLAFQRVIEIEPDYSLAHATLGGYYRRMGQEELAQHHIDKAMGAISEDENEYNRACMEAICGNTDRALELLEIALKNRQTSVEWVRRDPDLDFVRSDPRFNTLLLDYATRPTQ